jgi:hypothetical protein
MSMLTGNRDKIKARKRGQKPTDSRFVLKAGLTSLGFLGDKLYSRRESNPHAVKHWILNPTCLPIPPLEHVEYKNKHLINKY